MSRIDEIIKQTVNELFLQPHSAVAVILNDKNQILMGKALADDDRNNTLCFVGGGVEKDENPLDAAVREANEEAGVIVKVAEENGVLDYDFDKRVIFVKCLYDSGEIIPNEEFEFINWYDLDNLPSEEIYPHNLGIIEKIKTPLNAN